MNERRRLLAVSVTACMIVTGCAGAWPVRWPSREFWVSHPVEYQGIHLPSLDVGSYPNRMEQQGVSVAALLFTPDETRDRVHIDLRRDRIQPLMIVMRNDSDQTYAFRKADVDARYLTARGAARGAQVHPVVHTARLVRWLVWLLPGALFNAVIEPSTGLPFDGVDEIARRPPTPRNRDVREDFLRHEIADGQIAPRESMSGLMFLHPPKLGSMLQVKLVNTRTQEPLVFVFLARAPVARVYPKPYDVVWEAAASSVGHLAPWTVRSTDKTNGILKLTYGGRFFFWGNRAELTVSVKRLDEQRTQVTVDSRPQRMRGVWYGTLGQIIEQAIERLLAPLDSSFIVHPRRTSTMQQSRPSTSDAQPPSDSANAGSPEATPDSADTGQSSAAH